MCRIGENDVFSNGGEAILQGFDDRNEGEVDEHDVVLSMVDNIRNLLRKKPGIQRVTDCSITHDPEPGFHMSVGVPGHRGNPVTQFDTFILQRFCDFQGTPSDVHQGRAADRTFNGSCNLLTFAVILRRVVNNGVCQQGVILHQAKHR